MNITSKEITNDALITNSYIESSEQNFYLDCVKYLKADFIANNTINERENKNKASSILLNLSNYQRERIALANEIRNLELEHRNIYHLTITYKPYKNHQRSAKEINTFFKNFYIKKFLPDLLNTRNIHKNKKKSVQPICYTFIDEHTQKPSINKTDNLYINMMLFPVKLHHHAILAVHPETADRMNEIISTDNPMNKYSPVTMTSYIRECEPMCLLYASKKYDKYRDDTLIFPDRLHRRRKP